MSEQVCRECGCTDERACPGGCWWVEADLCSACQMKEEPAQVGREQIEQRLANMVMGQEGVVVVFSNPQETVLYSLGIDRRDVPAVLDRAVGISRAINESREQSG